MINYYGKDLKYVAGFQWWGSPLSRPDVVSRMWESIKKNNL
jgi:hypothetical protein